MKIETTGFDDRLEEDRPAIFVTHGEGNTPGEPELHIHVYDPENGIDQPLGWVKRDDLIDAIFSGSAVKA